MAEASSSACCNPPPFPRFSHSHGAQAEGGDAPGAVRELLAAGAATDARTTHDGLTPLMLAAEAGRSACVAALLDGKAAVDTAGSESHMTALHFAAQVCGAIAPAVQKKQQMPLCQPPAPSAPSRQSTLVCPRARWLPRTLSSLFSDRALHQTRLPPGGCSGQRACQHAQLGIPETAHGPTLGYHLA
jgi:hypothetical protein